MNGIDFSSSLSAELDDVAESMESGEYYSGCSNNNNLLHLSNKALIASASALTEENTNHNISIDSTKQNRT